MGAEETSLNQLNLLVKMNARTGSGRLVKRETLFRFKNYKIVGESLDLPPPERKRCILTPSNLYLSQQNQSFAVFQESVFFFIKVFLVRLDYILTQKCCTSRIDYYRILKIMNFH